MHPQMPDDPNLTEAQLKAELDNSKKAWDEALVALRKLTAEVPSGLPHPDGVQRLRNAAAQEQLSAAVYLAALNRFTDRIMKRPLRESRPQKKSA